MGDRDPIFKNENLNEKFFMGGSCDDSMDVANLFIEILKIPRCPH